MEYTSNSYRIIEGCQHVTGWTCKHTSRKYGKKEPQSFSHCGSFDHLDLQSLNNCIFVFLGFMTAILKFWGHIIHCWKDIFKTYLEVY